MRYFTHHKAEFSEIDIIELFKIVNYKTKKIGPAMLICKYLRFTEAYVVIRRL